MWRGGGRGTGMGRKSCLLATLRFVSVNSTALKRRPPERELHFRFRCSFELRSGQTPLAQVGDKCFVETTVRSALPPPLWWRRVGGFRTAFSLRFNPHPNSEPLQDTSSLLPASLSLSLPADPTHRQIQHAPNRTLRVPPARRPHRLATQLRNHGCRSPRLRST